MLTDDADPLTGPASSHLSRFDSGRAALATADSGGYNPKCARSFAGDLRTAVDGRGRFQAGVILFDAGVWDRIPIMLD